MQRPVFVVTASLALASPVAGAVCVITDPSPTGTLTSAPGGQTFQFVATDDCTQLGFTVPLVNMRKTPLRGDPVGTGRHLYTVHLSESELNTAIRIYDPWFVWIASGHDPRSFRVQTLNDLDFDDDGWTRSEGDTGACDLHPNRGPGVTDVVGNGIDEDCDGEVDNVRYGIPDALVGVDQSGSYLGNQMTVGDVDGDGFADLEIALGTANGGHGGVYVVYGPTDGDYDVADAVELTTATAYVGSNVDVGDADVDGIGDLLTGGVVGDGAYLFLGPITADRRTRDAAALFQGPSGTSSAADVDLVPDFDGDGFGDVVIGASTTAPDNTGAVYVASGATSGTVSLETSASYMFVGPARYSQFGRNDFEVGDVTGDGIEDLAFGTPNAIAGYGAAPTVYLVEGGLPPGTYEVASDALATFTGERALTYIGVGVASGDYDGDGSPDLIVGDSQALTAGGEYSGKAYGFFGPFSGTTSATDAQVSWEGTEGWIEIGAAVAAADVDGDDALDVLIGAPSAGANLGEVYLQRGATTGVVDVATLPKFSGHEIPDEFGTRIVTIPDWDGDGGDEIAIGAPRVDDWRGTVSVFDSGSLF